MRQPRSIKPFGPDALLLEWEQRIDPTIHRGVLAYVRALEDQPGIVECIPAYASLLVRCPGRAAEWHERLYDWRVQDIVHTEGRLHRMPVCYGGAHGPDLARVASTLGLSEAEVIERHTAVPYRVYLFGFRPGFAFLGSLDERIAVNRRATPRKVVPAGAVGLAGRQTGIYPEPSPGGWQLIGHCPLPLIDTAGHTRFTVGDQVQFFAVEGEALDRQQAADTWPDN